ncbi:hypothetical protein H8739_01115 [Blautia faecis]|jgi:hypothetical protein|uniref:hypothetical protein n=1 Tax=Blautia faecis TaxID=871665 RepID=UPI00165628EA|nr:hypothetical protein [Blautia faecis]MBC8612324.1 hypothetical protein [Blautia faecis]
MVYFDIPEDQILNLPDEQLIAIAQYYLLMLDIDWDTDPISDEQVEKSYQRFLKRLAG